MQTIDTQNVPEADEAATSAVGFDELGLSDIALKACERARYAGVTLGAEELRALKEAAATAMDSLEASVRAA